MHVSKITSPTPRKPWRAREELEIFVETSKTSVLLRDSGQRMLWTQHPTT